MTPSRFDRKSHERLAERAGAGRLLKALVRRGLEREDLPAAAALVLQLDVDADVRSAIGRGTAKFSSERTRTPEPSRRLSPFSFATDPEIVPSSDRSRYGREHRALRKRLQRDVDAGFAVCWRCGGQVLPGMPWHLGHDVSGQAHMGVEHVRCNLSAAGKARARQLYGPAADEEPRPPRSRDW
jgi:hypothetical protein